MTEKKKFHTDKAGVSGGPYSQAIIHNNIIYVSGQGAIDPATNEISLGNIEHETKLAMENIKIILEEAGSSLDRILTITAYLLDMEDYAGFNTVYKSCFKGDLPARTCIRAAELPFDTRVEVTATAYI
ncbi:MAG: Rid family detoxifying hydrolase [Thermodesulfobacteriota bacterium]